MNHEHILKSICKQYGVNHNDIFCETRGDMKTNWVRQLFTYCLWRFTNLNSTQIGEIIGRDRSVVSTTVKAVNTRCLYYPEVRDEVIQIETMFE